jgi:uncharacterized protein YndB with AHSA1/START domain
MLMFKARREAHIDAAPEQVFDVVSDLRRHPEIAGSGEVRTIRLTDDAPLHVGSRWEADERIHMGRRDVDFVATSEMVEYDAPRRLSWTSMPPPPVNKPEMRRIQWTYDITPDGSGSRVVETVEVEPKSAAIGLVMKPIYRVIRGGAVQRGMERTLDNIRLAAERTPEGGGAPR